MSIFRPRQITIKLSHLCGAALAIVVFLLIVGCTPPKVTIAPRQPMFFYLAGAVKNEAEQALTEAALYQIEETTTPQDSVRIDYLAGNRVQNVYSNAPDKQALWGLASSLPVMPSSPASISSAIYTTGDIARQNPDIYVQAIIATSGTSNRTAIDAIGSATVSISDLSNFHIAVVGVNPQNRVLLSNGFSVIADRVQFATTEQETAALFDGFGG